MGAQRRGVECAHPETGSRWRLVSQTGRLIMAFTEAEFRVSQVSFGTLSFVGFVFMQPFCFFNKSDRCQLKIGVTRWPAF